ncbi:MAG TPA: ABC transporter substrate-binding protein [Solirubrobacterales bacterium]|nr:ABC transporter substrate-binding protein [Solirubrobacterales bacterium]
MATSSVPTAGFWEGTAAKPTGGFEYELARKLAERFELDHVRIEVVHFHRIVAGDLGGADLALALITPTEEREEALDFSSPYLDAPPTVVVRSGTEVPDLADAQELRWGAVRATTFVDTISDRIAPEEPLRIYDRQEQMLAALEAGKVEAVLFDLPLAVAIADESNGRLEAVAQLPNPEEIAAALPQGSENAEAVDSALRSLAADETIHDLLEEWVGPEAADAEHALPLLRTSR